MATEKKPTERTVIIFQGTVHARSTELDLSGLFVAGGKLQKK